MDIANDGPRRGERSLTRQLKAKSRRRREGLERLRSPSPARAPRNDPLPNLDLAYIPLEDLRMPSREIRKLDPAHVREVANAISTLGFCAPVLVGKDNARHRRRRSGRGGAAARPRPRPVRADRAPERDRAARPAPRRQSPRREGRVEPRRAQDRVRGADPRRRADRGLRLHARRDRPHRPRRGRTTRSKQGPLAPEAGAIAVARIGDVFDLGPHRIVCGSATDPETLRRLMEGDAPARLVLTDEPYNVPIAGHVTGGRHREFAMASGEMTDAEFLAFNEAWMAAVLSLPLRRRRLRHLHRLARLSDRPLRGGQARPQAPQPHRLDEDQRRHGQPLPLPA